jgi:hypothetical protein
VGVQPPQQQLVCNLHKHCMSLLLLLALLLVAGLLLHMD